MPPLALTVTVELPPLHSIAVLDELAVRVVQIIGFSAIKIAAHALFPPEGTLVADPAPVEEPAVVFMPHPAPAFPLVSKMLPYNSPRPGGDGCDVAV